MSAFVVGTDHIDYLATAVNLAAARPYGLGSALVTDAQAERIRALGGGAGRATLTRNAFAGPDEFLWAPAANLDLFGRILLDENVRSVSTRYPDDRPADLPGPRPMIVPAEYAYRSVPREQITPAQTIRAIECWQYQTCEYDDHQQAAGWQATELLYRAAVRDLMGERHDLAWEWDRDRIPTIPSQA